MLPSSRLAPGPGASPEGCAFLRTCSRVALTATMKRLLEAHQGRGTVLNAYVISKAGTRSRSGSMFFVRTWCIVVLSRRTEAGEAAAARVQDDVILNEPYNCQLP